MDWEKWREEEDERQRELARAKELRTMLGIENRSRLRFWFDMITTGTFLLVGIALIIVGLPWVFELYRNDPTLWPTAREQMKDMAPPAILAFVTSIALVLLFSRKK